MDVDSLLDSLSSGDRVVYTFVMAWVVCGVVWLALDWIGNPNRGVFRPKREEVTGTWKERRAARRLKRAEDDASVRATLRDAYGASSLRVLWSRKHEAEVIEADEALVRGYPLAPRRRFKRGRLLELDEFTDRYEPVLRRDGYLPTYDPADPPELPMPIPRGRWRTGMDPRMANRNGNQPTAATIRSRVWKNHAGEPVWGPTNQERMKAGKPPRRRNPLTGKIETGAVELTAGTPYWKGAITDPFTGGTEP